MVAKKKKEQVIKSSVDYLNKPLDKHIISNVLKENISKFKTLFTDDDTFVAKEFENEHNSELKYCLIHCRGLVNSKVINEDIIWPLMYDVNIENSDDVLNSLIKKIVLIDDIKKTKSIKKIIENVTYGDAVLFIDGIDEALILNTKQFQLRSIAEPESEKVISGPREGFTESLLLNLSLVRRKLRTNELKLKYLNLGKKTHTDVCICYIDSIVDKNKLKELNKRLNKINIDGVLDTHYITELIGDKRFSPFPTTGFTERPDVVVGKILEGRIAIFLDGTPVVLTVPYLFIENFQSSEDYYLNYYYTSFSRFLRIIGFAFAIIVPSFYIAIVAFHHEMLPTPLFINVAMERQSVPLPAALEVLIMLIIFDILKETGIRMTNNIAQALSIVGALVIGQAAVDARLIAAPMVIIVSFTGITSLLVPKLNAAVIVMRFCFLILASSLGLFGLVIGIAFLAVHILNLTSLNVPQFSLTGKFKFQKGKDTVFRAPWWKMYLRPAFITNNRKRMK